MESGDGELCLSLFAADDVNASLFDAEDVNGSVGGAVKPICGAGEEDFRDDGVVVVLVIGRVKLVGGAGAIIEGALDPLASESSSSLEDERSNSFGRPRAWTLVMSFAR